MGGAPRGIARRLPELWYRRQLAPALLPLLPLSWLFGLLAAGRRALYRRGCLTSTRLPVPVVVVGNLTVGGSGKTPLVLWLVEALRKRGRRPGIVSRGYGGEGQGVFRVLPDAAAGQVGDEPLLLARRSGVPVFAGRDRVAAAQALLAAHPECDTIVADDGLQHYRLQRDAELVVFDARGAGNGHLLPAGPLREPLRRLSRASAVVWNGLHEGGARHAARALPQYSMRLAGQRLVSLQDATVVCSLAQWRSGLHGRLVHALAGIGDPSRFFRQLQALGIEFEAHPFPDHHAYTSGELAFARDGVLLMTEKDAVKCAAIYSGEAWVLPVDARVEGESGAPDLLETLLEKFNGRSPA